MFAALTNNQFEVRYMHIILLVILSVAISLFVTTKSFSQTMHAFVFAGTDDMSSVLRSGIKIMKDDIERELATVASTLNINLNKQVFSDQDFNEELLNWAIDRLTVGTDDIIFFYFIGHGINRPQIDSKWPQLSFRKSRTEDGSVLVSFSEIVQKLEQKNPRLLIAIAEACNNTSGRTEYHQEDISGLASLNFAIRDKERIKDLYIHSAGKVICSSSEAGQSSWVSGRDGGYFGRSFIEVQKELTSISSFADWNTLLEKVKSRTHSLVSNSSRGRIQLPQYIANVRGIRRPNSYNWQNDFERKPAEYQSQTSFINYNMHYQNQMQFLVAKVVFFGNNRVYFIMPDNFITEYNYFGGLSVAGYRVAPAYPNLFQYDIISYYSPVNFRRWGVDGFGNIMDFYNGQWRQVGIIYY